MVSIELPELQHVDAALETDTKKGVFGGGYRIEGRLSIGVPNSFVITTDLVASDALLKGFLESNGKEFVFYVTSLACTFQPGDDESFARAWLNLQLARTGQLADKGQAIAWSMQPVRLEESFKTSTTVKLGVDLKFVEVSPEVITDGVQKEIMIQAFNEGQSDPYWQFTKTPHSPLEGSYRLALVVRTLAGSKTHGSIRVKADVLRRKFGLFTYKADFSGAPKMDFELP
jgi:hypothetical protein